MFFSAKAYPVRGSKVIGEPAAAGVMVDKRDHGVVPSPESRIEEHHGRFRMGSVVWLGREKTSHVEIL